MKLNINALRTLCLVISLIFIFTVPAAWGADSEPLKILSIYPSGEAPRVKQFTVTFNQPMVPLGKMERSPNDVPMSISPKIQGQYRWLNVYTLAFEPDHPLEGANKGTITIKAQAQALSGARLGEDRIVRYSLPLPELTQTQPSEGTDDLALQEEFSLTFNQPIQLESLKEKVYFSAVGKKIPVEVIDHEKINEDRKVGEPWAVLVKPSRNLPRNAQFQIVVEPGLASTAGPLPSDKEKLLYFTTYGPLRVVEIRGYSPSENAPYDPESGLEIRLSNPISRKDLIKHLKITPEYDFSRIADSDYMEEEGRSFWLPGPLKPESTYAFVFSNDLKDVYGQKIVGKNRFRITLGPARPVLDLPGRQGVLETTNDPRYPFQVRNVQTVRVRGYFLSPEKAIPFIIDRKLYRYLYQSDKDLLNGIPRKEIATTRIKVESPANVMTWQPVELKKLFGDKVGQGIMYFDLSAKETDYEKSQKTRYYRSLVQVTNIGLSVKFGQSNTLIWTTDLKTGSPLPKVKLELRDADNKTVWRGFSDEEGLARAPGASILRDNNQNQEYGRPLFFVLARHQDEFSMVSTEWNDGISPWNFGLSGRELRSGGDLLTWALTSLPLYKPGDEVQFKIIQRQSEAQGLRPTGTQRLWIQVQDSRGKILLEDWSDVTKFGTASGQLNLTANASLGHYSIMVGPDKDSLRFAGTFRVEEYRKPTFTVEVEPSQKSGFIGDEISSEIKAVYHFGSPVKNRPAQYNVLVNPAEFEIPRFEDYSIQDDISEVEETQEPSPIVAKGKLNLDDKGQAKVEFKATAARKVIPREFQVEATVTDVDQRTVSQRASVLIHPASFYLGLKTNTYLVRSGENIDVQLIAAAPDGKLVPDVETDLVLYRRTWQTVRRKGVGGYYNYVSKPTDSVVEKSRVKTNNEPIKIQFKVNNSGYYYVAASAGDATGRTASTAAGFYAYGGDSAGWGHYDHDRIDLIPDKKEYKPGEAAVIMVKSPYTSGTGLLTVERNGVRRHQVFTIENASPTVRVELEKEDNPNVFVSVLLVRGRISETLDKLGRDPGKPGFKVGYTELKVLDDRHQLKVTVTPDRPEARPGEEVELSVQVTDAKGKPRQSEVAMIVADAALLQLASENVYYPERLFFSPRPLSVWTADIRLNLIGRRHYGLKGAQPGGGGLGRDGDRFRKRFVSLALFKPHLITDEKGQARVKFKLPDNLTTFKIFAVANDDGDCFGTGKNLILVTKPLLIKPALPGFAGVGDEFTAAVTIHNRGKSDGEAEIQLEGDHFEYLDSTSRNIKLKAGESREVGFPVRIEPGSRALFKYRIKMGEETDAAEYPVPLRFPSLISTSATYGQVSTSAQETILLPGEADPHRGGLTINVSPSLIGSMAGALDYLDEYPYQCLEQKTSRAWGDFFQVVWQKRLGLDKNKVDKSSRRINALINELSGYQDYQGGFRFWTGSDQPDPYLTGYVLQFINQIRSSGFEADRYLVDRAKRYIKNLLNHNRWPKWYNERYRLAAGTYLVSVLAETGEPVAPMVENLYGKRGDMTAFELALLIKTIGLTGNGKGSAKQIKDLTDRLFGVAVFTSGELHFEGKSYLYGLMGSKVRTNAFVLKALLQTQPKSPHVISLARWLVREQRDGHWGNTQSNAVVLSAISDYMTQLESKAPNGTLKIDMDGKEIADAVFRHFDDPQLNRTVPAGDLTPGKKTPLSLNFDGQGSLYYNLRLKYAPLEPDLEPQRAGFSLSRSYTVVDTGVEGSAKSGDVSTFRRGDIVRVDLTLLVPSQRNWVVLEDMLPAGLEPINFDLPVAPQHLKNLLEQGSRPHDYFSRYWYDHREIRPQRVTVFARSLMEGVYNFSYLARAVTPGKFITPGPKAEEMYSPEVHGRGPGVKVEVLSE